MSCFLATAFLGMYHEEILSWASAGPGTGLSLGGGTGGQVGVALGWGETGKRGVAHCGIL